jgi:hypothetical protein
VDDGFVQDLAAAASYLRGMLSHRSTGMPVVDAQEDFLRARRAHVAARLVRRTRVPRTFPGTAGVYEVRPTVAFGFGIDETFVPTRWRSPERPDRGNR